MTMPQLFLTAIPYPGNVISSVYLDENNVQRVTYSGSLYNNNGPDFTIDEYRKANSVEHAEVMSWDELWPHVKAFNETLKTKPSRITYQEHDDALGCLPPCRWHHVGDWGVFHISEHLRDDLVQWYASYIPELLDRKQDKYVTWCDSCYMSDAEIATTLDAA